MDACSELGYVRNHTAVNIAEEKTLAAITPTLSNMYYVHMAESMQWRARELGYSLMVFNTFREIHQETQGIFLTLLVKSDENIIQDNGKRFNLLTK